MNGQGKDYFFRIRSRLDAFLQSRPVRFHWSSTAVRKLKAAEDNEIRARLHIPLKCPYCDTITPEGELCAECQAAEAEAHADAVRHGDYHG